jgi:hypothetical protein
MIFKLSRSHHSLSGGQIMISRRKWLGCSLVLGGSLGTVLSMTGEPIPESKEPIQDLWPYHEIDPAAVEQLAYENYFKGYCCYGAFIGILMPLATKYGRPYRDFPFKMMEYGAGGISGSGNLCGGLNGCAAAIGLFHDGAIRAKLTKQLFQWYSATELPLYEPTKPVLTNMPILRSAAQSLLCPASITAWRQKSGSKFDSPERQERCARLTADVSRKTVELLNLQIQKD